MNQNIARPNKLENFIGKKQIKSNLETYIKSSKINNKPFDHCLIYGLPGTGKTSLALILAKELDVNIRIIQGPNIVKPNDIFNLILSINENDIIFIDEIHAINSLCFELLYSAMEDNCIDINIGKDFNSKTTRIKLPKFTLIGATTNPSKIPQPLEDRFGIIINLHLYNEKEIEEIILNYIKKINLKLSKNDVSIIASNCRGIPRIAIRIVNRINDFYSTNNKTNISLILKKLGVIHDGLNENDLEYLKILASCNKPLGIKTLLQFTKWENDFIENKIEPYLIFRHYIEKTSKGRMITNKGIEFVNAFSSSNN